MTETVLDWSKSAAFLWRVACDAVRMHEERHHRATPKPIPEWLYPQPDEAAEAWLKGGWPETSDEAFLVMVATAEEWTTIARLVLTVEPPAGANVRTLWRDGSPWLEVAIVTGASAEARRVERFAIWRYTLAVHRIGDNGAVEDEPMELAG